MFMNIIFSWSSNGSACLYLFVNQQTAQNSSLEMLKLEYSLFEDIRYNWKLGVHTVFYFKRKVQGLVIGYRCFDLMAF